MRTCVSALCVAVSLISLTACASVTVKPATNATESGVRFYRPDPYLAISRVKTEGGKVGDALQAEIIWLPNKNQEYIITASAGLGAVAYAPTLTNGWNLVGLDVKVDSKGSEVLSAMTGLFTALRSAAADPSDKESVKPGLYRILFDPNTGVVSGVDFEHPIFREK